MQSDIGQSGANIGATGMAAFEATGPIIQGVNVGAGVYASQNPPLPPKTE
jgi:hypothetical protein